MQPAWKRWQWAVTRLLKSQPAVAVTELLKSQPAMAVTELLLSLNVPNDRKERGMMVA